MSREYSPLNSSRTEQELLDSKINAYQAALADSEDMDEDYQSTLEELKRLRDLREKMNRN